MPFLFCVHPASVFLFSFPVPSSPHEYFAELLDSICVCENSYWLEKCLPMCDWSTKDFLMTHLGAFVLNQLDSLSLSTAQRYNSACLIRLGSPILEVWINPANQIKSLQDTSPIIKKNSSALLSIIL